MILEDEVQALIHLGLTANQAKVYLSFVRSGVSTVKTITNVSGVPRQEIYHVLDVLQKQGLVKKIISRPSKFVAIPIQDAISMLFENKTKEFSELEKEATNLFTNVKNDTEPTEEEKKQQFIMLSTRNQIRKKTKEELDKVQTSIGLICLSKVVVPVFWEVDEYLKKARKRGVTMKLITDKPEDEKEFSVTIQHYKGLLEVKYLSSFPPVHLALYDKKERLLTTTTRAYAEEVLWSNNTILLTIVNNYFELMWSTATEK